MYKENEEALNCDGFWTMDDLQLGSRLCMICGQLEEHHK